MTQYISQFQVQGRDSSKTCFTKLDVGRHQFGNTFSITCTVSNVCCCVDDRKWLRKRRTWSLCSKDSGNMSIPRSLRRFLIKCFFRTQSVRCGKQ